MANLIRRGVFDDLFDVRQTFDRMLRNLFTGLEWPSERSAWALLGGPPIQAWIDKDGRNYHLKVALPGVDPKDVQVELQGDNLMVGGSTIPRKGRKEPSTYSENFPTGDLSELSRCRKEQKHQSSLLSITTACWKSQFRSAKRACQNQLKWKSLKRRGQAFRKKMHYG